MSSELPAQPMCSTEGNLEDPSRGAGTDRSPDGQLPVEVTGAPLPHDSVTCWTPPRTGQPAGGGGAIPPATADRAPVLVLGVGNELFADEGLGVVAARQLAALGLPGVEVLEAGMLETSLLREIVDRSALLVLDAVVDSGLPGGEVVVLTAAELERCRSLLLSAHQLGVLDALLEAEVAGRAPRRVVAMGLPPAELDTGYGLSVLVEAALGRVVRRALDQLAEWDVPVPVHLRAHPPRWG